MKHIVSVSLGSSKRDARAERDLLGEHVVIERIGTDGDLRRFARMLTELDGKVDAIGLGGMDRWLYVERRRYEIRDAARLARLVRRTPVVDGSGIKNTWEKHLITDYLPRHAGLEFRGRTVLQVSSVDRYGMAEAFARAGADVVYGDFLFALGLPIRLRTLRQVRILAAILLPVLTKLPITMLYPTGAKQETIVPKWERDYARAEVLAGDFLFIRRHLPADLRGKTILTNTVTPDDVAMLRDRGARLLVTTTPELDGRSFGTNVLEGTLVAISGRPPEAWRPADYLEWMERLNFRPRIEPLAPVPAVP